MSAEPRRARLTFALFALVIAYDGSLTAASAQTPAPLPTFTAVRLEFPSADDPRAARIQLPPPRSMATETNQDPQSSVGDLAMAGLGLAAVGAGTGWVIGRYTLDSIEAGLAGAALGESLGMATGVHFASNGEGPLGPSSFANIAIASVAYVLVLTTRTDRSVIAAAVITPLIQLPITIGIERN